MFKKKSQNVRIKKETFGKHVDANWKAIFFIQLPNFTASIIFPIKSHAIVGLPSFTL